MRGAFVACLAVVAATVAACGDSAERGWAPEVDLLIDELATAYDISDSYQTARFYSAGGTLDFSVWGEGVASTPAAVVAAVEGRWFHAPGRADVRAEHVFVSPDGAVVWWHAHDLDGFQNWVQTYAFGARNRVTSRAFRSYEAPFVPREDATRAGYVQFAERYVEVWSTGDADAADELYADVVVVRDDVGDEVWRGLDAVAAEVAHAPAIELGPWPRLFTYDVDGGLEAVALVRAVDDCPRLEARRWVFAGDRIAYETRYTHLESARRCGTGGGDGWWTTFDFPAVLEDNVTELVDAGGVTMELVNAEPVHADFARWLVDRYRAAGLGPPEIAAMWFPPSLDCLDQVGLAITYDHRYDEEHTIVVCFAEDRIGSESSESGWSTPAISVGLHELAHVWLRDQIDDDMRDEFVRHIGADGWRDRSVAPRNRGVEHAAYAISWGLAGTVDARYPLQPPPSCDELAGRYELLTGRQPLTSCGDGGWSQ